MADLTRPRFVLLVALLGSLTMLGPTSIDTSLPAMPAMAAGLGVEVGTIEFSLAALFLGAAIGQLIYGPLADRFGRRPVILGVVGFYFACALGAGFAPNAEILALWRFLQGLVTASGRLLANAAARDILARERLGRMLSMVMVVGAASAIAAPVVGGFLSQSFGWQSVFFYMAAVSGAIFVFFWLFFTETQAERDPGALSRAGLLGNSRHILGNRSFLAYLSVAGLNLAGLGAILTGASAVLIGGFGVTPTAFGTMFAMIMTGHLCAIVIGGRLVVRFGINRLIRAGTLIAAIGGLAMLGLALPGWAWGGSTDPLVVFLPLLVFMIGFSLVQPQAIAGALTPFPRNAGIASSLIGFLQNLMATAAAFLVGLFSDGTQLPLAVVISAVSLAGLGLAWRLADKEN